MATFLSAKHLEIGVRVNGYILFCTKFKNICREGIEREVF